MKWTKFFGLAVLFLVVSFTPAYAQQTIINVPGDHGTIQEAVDAVVADNTTIKVNYNYGTHYVENVVVNTSFAGLTIEGVGGGRPICEGKGGGKPSNSQNAFTISSINVTLRGLDIVYGRNNCVRIEESADNAVIDDCYIYGWEGKPNNEEAIGGIRVLANGVIVKNCTIDGGAGWTKNVRFEGVAVRKVNGFEFDNNTVMNVTWVPSYSPNGGLRFASLYGAQAGALTGELKVTNNTFINNHFAVSCDNDSSAASTCSLTIFNNYVEASSSGLVLYEFPIGSGITATIERNSIYMQNAGSGSRGILVGEIGGGNITIRNNFISGTHLAITSYWSSYETLGADGIKVYNNTLYNCEERGIDLSSGAGVSTGWDIKNNIIHMAESGEYGIYLPEDQTAHTLISDYNCIYAPGSATPTMAYAGAAVNWGEWTLTHGYDANSITGNPGFASENPLDLHIASGSLCINEGVNLGSDVPDDIDGESRPPGSDYDIGADEFSGDLPPVVTITAPFDNSSSGSGELIGFAGMAIDEDGDLTPSLVWTSDIDGQIGTGGSFSTTLSVGSHTITASVTDSGNRTGSDSINITVTEPGTVTVNSIYPGSAPVGTTASVNIAGSGFATGAEVTFENGAGAAPIASNINVTVPSTITATITVKSGGPPRERIWDVRVTNPDNSTGVLPGGFTVTVPTGAPGGPLTMELLQNNPNPCNPETWIPFRLSEAEHVIIKIHSLTGQLVKTLDLGNKPAGAYATKERAAYWDGKNEAGEYVGSGLYFYTIQAGDFIATKKMVIAR